MEDTSDYVFYLVLGGIFLIMCCSALLLILGFAIDKLFGFIFRCINLRIYRMLERPDEDYFYREQ